MPKGRHTNQGVKLMIIRDYLIRNTRKDDHCVSAKVIADYLSKQEGIPTDIKTVYSDLNRLRDNYGLKIEYSAKHKGWYLANPEFEPNEVRLMIDSVQSTKYITQKEADLLTSKLKGLTDKYTATSL